MYMVIRGAVFVKDGCIFSSRNNSADRIKDDFMLELKGLKAGCEEESRFLA